MASYNELLALIDAYINRNGVQAITGQILNGVLKAMVDQLGRGYTLMGYAEPTGDPGTPDGPESWFASVPGTYTNYGEIQVAAGELALLSFAPSEGWTKNTIYEGFREVTADIDGNVGTPEVGVSYANGVLSFDFRNMKGNPGEDGDPAGFGSVTASVDDQVGTPSVSVSSSGPDTAKNFAFAFHNLKGETGVTSVVATVDNTSGNPQCSVSLQGGQLTLAFTGLKGAQGNTGSSVDYPFTIVNNLTTDDPTQALSAAQGVVLDGKVSQLEAKVDENKAYILGDVTIEKNIVWADGYVGYRGNVLSSQTSQFSQPVLFHKGEILQYRTNELYASACFAVSSNAPVSVGDTLTGQSLFNYNVKDKVVEYTAESDMYLVITVLKEDYSISFSRHEDNSLKRLGEEVDALVEEVDGLGEEVGENTQRISSLESNFIESESSVKDSMITTDLYIASSDGTWKVSGTQVTPAKYIYVPKNSTIVVKASDEKEAIFAFVNAIGPSGTAPVYPEWANGKQTISAGTSKSTFVESDCFLWVFFHRTNIDDITPKAITAKTTKVKQDAPKVERFGINLLNEENLSTGSLGIDGGFLATGGNIVSDYIDIADGGLLYQKTQYLHICCGIFKNSNFGFGATRVCVYDATKTFIAKLDNVASAIDKESQENSSFFASAAYVRVEFAAGCDFLYVAKHNFTHLPYYSPFDDASLSATTESIAETIRNSDGAKTNILRTGLDYVNANTEMGLGYGDSATAFDETVEPVTNDPWNGEYPGLRKQINCSTFVQLCMMGILYRNSRYVLGSDAENIGLNGYTFDSKAEYNYHTGTQARVVPCSNHGKLYANKLFKYAYDRGLSFLVAPGFRNIDVGDILFVSNVSTDDQFGQVGHCEFVSRSILLKDGTRKVYVMQVSGGYAYNLARETELSSKPDNLVFAARFPLPNVQSITEDLVASVTSSSVSGFSSGDEVLGTVSLKKNIGSRSIVTIAIAVDNIPEGAEIIVKAGSTALGVNGANIFVRGDNVVVKHIHLLVDTAINTDTLTIAVRANSSWEGTIALLSAKVYDGYVTL